jgi:DNA-binding transcriptional ArsR family regulator
LEAINALSALASDPRLTVFRLLVKRGPEGYTPSELIERLEVPAPTLSFHLKGLMHAGLVVSRREGRNLYYSPNFERMNALVGFLTENCCSLADEACEINCQPRTGTAAQRKRA